MVISAGVSGCSTRSLRRSAGVADHVHILLGLRATHRLADVVREVKKASSRWDP